jgi:hypothetical protein
VCEFGCLVLCFVSFSKRIFIALETLKFVLHLLNYSIKTVKKFKDNNEFFHKLGMFSLSLMENK